MEERRKKKTKKEPRKTPQTRIKELRKDIDAFQTEVDNMLKSVSTIVQQDNTCEICHNTITEYEDLICQHVICRSCFDANRSTRCPICENNLERFDSSSSSEDFS